MENKYFTKEQRIEIYENALNDFKKNAKGVLYRGRIYGMCSSLYSAVRNFNYGEYVWVDINAKNFPEFYAFKPKTTWRVNSSYWFTYYAESGAYEIRESILTALAAGKTPKQWKKEWKAKNNK